MLPGGLEKSGGSAPGPELARKRLILLYQNLSDSFLPMYASRKEAFSMQMLQLLDAGLVGIAFWAASRLSSQTPEVGSVYGGETSLSRMSWVLYIVVPFTPLLLELLKFYTLPKTKTALLSFSQLLKALLVMALAIGTLFVFVPMPEASRVILYLGGFLALLVLFVRDRLLHSHGAR